MESNHRVFMFFDNDHVRKGKSVRRCPAPHQPFRERASPLLLGTAPSP